MKRYEYNYGKNPEGTLSTISGYATETTNFGETAFGILNKSTRDEENFTTPEVVSSSTATLFSVGNGTDHDSRKNIIELKADGTVYINGVGLYDGTNPGESTNIADEFQGIHDDITSLNEDVDRIDNTIESIHISEDDENLIYTLLVDGQERGTINIPRDQFLKDVSYNEETNNLEFTFIVRGEDNEEVEKQVNVNMTDLEDIYSEGDGLSLENKQFSVKIDADTQPYIEVSSNGVKVIGIDEKFDTVNLNVTDLTNRVTTAESDIDAILDELANLEGSGEGSVQDQINDALLNYLPLSGGTMNGSIEFTSGPDANGYEYVDLGLPSGNLWAKCNIGATNEEEAGLYFQWGDTQGYTAKQVGRGEGYKYFNYNDCKFNSGGSNTYSKYNNSDGKQFLDLEDDAAHVNMGGSWRMPTFADCKELFEYTNVEFLIEAPGRPIKKEESPSTESDDILYYDWEGGNIGMGNSWKYTGIRFSNKNNPDIYIIIPRAGCASEGRVGKSLLESFCQASSLLSESSANYFGGRYDFCGVSGSVRYYGYPIRGILPKSSNGIIISGKSDQDLLNAAGGTTSISDILAEVPSPDLSSYATKSELEDYLPEFTPIASAALYVRGIVSEVTATPVYSMLNANGITLLDENYESRGSDTELFNTNGGTVSIDDITSQVDLNGYLPLSGGSMLGNILFAPIPGTGGIGNILARGLTNPDDNGEFYYMMGSLGFSITATQLLGTRIIDMGRNPKERGGLGYLYFFDNNGNISLSVNPEGVVISNKSENDLLNAAGSTTSVSSIATQVQAAIVDSAPETLDTLNELAAALGDDPNFATTVTNQIAQKASISGLPSNIVPAILPTPIYSDNYVRIAHQYCAKDSSGTFGTAQSSFTQINAATSTTAGVMSAADKAKLDGIDISDYVTLDGEQTITGYKRFTGNIGCSGASHFNGQFYIGNSNLPIGTSNIINSLDNVYDTTRKAIGIGFAQNDTFSVRGGGPTDSGFAVICTEDQGNEPLYAAQIVNADGISRFKNIITLMDASGNQKFNEVTASGYAITDGTADEVLTADGDSNTLKTINGQTLLGSGDVDMSEFALKTDLDDYLSAGGGTVAGDISVESIEDTNTLTITNTGINISGKTSNDLITAGGGTVSVNTFATKEELGEYWKLNTSIISEGRQSGTNNKVKLAVLSGGSELGGDGSYIPLASFFITGSNRLGLFGLPDNGEFSVSGSDVLVIGFSNNKEPSTNYSSPTNIYLMGGYTDDSGSAAGLYMGAVGGFHNLKETRAIKYGVNGVFIYGKTSNDLLHAAGGTISIDDLKTQIISDLSAQVSTLQAQIAELTSRIEALETSLTKQEV